MKRGLLYLCVLFFQFSLAQNSINEAMKSYSDYFELPRESLFLHTNKTSYFPGETVWFTAYLYDRRENTPFITASNLHCSLFNKAGVKVDSFVVALENGVGSGQVVLPKDITGEQFFLKAQTKWMDNFKEDESFTAVLDVIRPFQTEVLNPESGSNPISMMPEGGHLVANTLNTVGIKLHKAQDFDSTIHFKLMASDGTELLNSIPINEHGLGRFQFVPTSGQDYYLETKDFEGESRSYPLETAKSQGITLSVNNLFEDKVVIQVKTNEKTLEAIRGTDHFVALHRDGLITFNTFQLENTTHTLRIPKDKLLAGTNIITVFDTNLNPILERLIFNEKNLKTTKASIVEDVKISKKDSVAFKINLFSKSKAKGLLSVSVLPEESTSNNANGSILSAFLIQPYASKTIGGLGHLLRDMDRTKKYALDMVLLADGWSQYEWKDIFDRSPDAKYAQDNGFVISGQVQNTKPEKNNLMTFYQESHPRFQQVEIGADGSFMVENAFVHKGEKLFFSLLNKRNKTAAPEITFEIKPTAKLANDHLSQAFLIPTASPFQGEETGMIPEASQQDFRIDDKTISLNEVVVSDEKIEKKLVHKPAGVSDALFNAVKITEDEVKLRPTLQQVLQKLGYRTVTTPIGNSIILPRSASPIVLPPAIVVDGITMYNPSRGIDNLPPNLLNSNTAGIDEIYYTHLPVEFGNRPVIYIYRKQGLYVGQKPEERFAAFVASEGFQRPKKFHNPIPTSSLSQQFKAYGAMLWESQIQTTEDGEAHIAFPKLEQKGAKIHIEGVTTDGNLISEFQTVSFE